MNFFMILKLCDQKWNLNTYFDAKYMSKKNKKLLSLSECIRARSILNVC